MPKSLTRALFVAAMVIAAVVGQATGTLASNVGNLVGRVETTASSNITSEMLNRLPLANVNVSAVAPSGSFKAITNAGGYYAITGLAPDTYVVTFALAGYVTQPHQGVTVLQDQTTVLNVVMQTGLTTLGKVTVRGATSLIQTNETANKYTVTPTQIQNITGTPQNISETAVLNSLPGITTDTGGYPIIRGGAENDEGYQLEGIDATEPYTGQFINSLSLAGVSSLVLSTGGYDVTNGNTNSGVINEVIKRGAYPGTGQMTFASNGSNFDHRFAIEYGNGTPDNRFSYYYAFSGLRQFRVYGDQKTFLPQLVSQVGSTSGNENVLNLFYRWGGDNRNELQYLGETGAGYFGFDYNTLQYGGATSAICNSVGGVGTQTCLPYGSANLQVKNTAGVGASAQAHSILFPGQVGLNQAINYADNENNVHFIQKIAYKRQFSSSSYMGIRIFRTNVHDMFQLPWNGGAFNDAVQNVAVNNLGVGVDYQNQLSNQHLVTVGAETIYTTGTLLAGGTSISPLIEPLEKGTKNNPVLTPFNYIAGYNCFPVGSPSCPVSTFADPRQYLNDPVNRSNVYAQDEWMPNDKLTVKLGVRYDVEALHLPSNAAALSTTYVQDASGNIVEVPGAAIGADITQPSQFSPRIALTFTPNADARNVFRASAGTTIQFAPLVTIENLFNISPAAYACTVASGCYHTMPGFSPTCVNGKDPMNSFAGCNSVTNLGQQQLLDLNTNSFAQYTPVKPERAFSADFSWSHDFTGGLTTRVTPYYRRGNNYAITSQSLIGTLSDGTPIFGPSVTSSLGENKSTGVEFAIAKSAVFGFSGYLNGTYDNTFANYNSDFFPAPNIAGLALNHQYHVSYLAPVTATAGVTYHDRKGLWITSSFPYESGYRYGVGTKTFVFANCSDVTGCVGPAGSQTPVQVLNTDMAAASLGLNSNTSAYYFTDPANPGTILHPNITGSRGTPEGSDPGTLLSPSHLLVNLSIAHEVGSGPNNFLVGVRATNLLGDFSPTVVGTTSRYRNNGLGGFNGIAGCTNFTNCGNGAIISGSNVVNPTLQPLQFPRSPQPYESEATGPARLFTFFVSSHF